MEYFGRNASNTEIHPSAKDSGTKHELLIDMRDGAETTDTNGLTWRLSVEFERKFKAFDILTLNQSVKSVLFLHSDKAIFQSRFVL